MKFAAIACIAAFAAAPAFAQAAATVSDTIKEVTTKGVVIEVQGQAFNVDYTPDGKFVGGDGMFGGTWTADGNKLCISLPDMGVENQCTEYPDGKKSGDSFELAGDMGAMTVTIR
jgi:hypothetical protein